MEGTDSVSVAMQGMEDYAKSSIYASADSDSLLLDNPSLKNLIFLFKTKGSLIQNKEYSGGDCGGKFKRLLYERDTLTIDKYRCGEYGFGNSQYLTNGDSLRLVRNYKMEWAAQSDGNEFTVTEKIYEFVTAKVTISERTKVINGWRDYDFANLPFVITISAGQIEYTGLKKEHRELLNGEILPK